MAPVVSGFSEPKEFDDEIDDLVENAMNKFFRPEFLNRMDGKVIFKSLKQEDVLKIAEDRSNESTDLRQESKSTSSWKQTSSLPKKSRAVIS